MEKNIAKLPEYIVLYIIPYTYNLQKKILLDDIRNFTKSKNILQYLYYKFWIIEKGMSVPEHNNWLINDIFGYANNKNALMFGYTDKFLNIFSRNTFLKNNEKIKLYVDKLEQKDVLQQINIFLGLLTIEERKNIISNFLIHNYRNISLNIH